MIEIENRPCAISIGGFESELNGFVLRSRCWRIRANRELQEPNYRVIPAGFELSLAQLLESSIDVRIVFHEVEIRLRSHIVSCFCPTLLLA